MKFSLMVRSTVAISFMFPVVAAVGGGFGCGSSSQTKGTGGAGGMLSSVGGSMGVGGSVGVGGSTGVGGSRGGAAGTTPATGGAGGSGPSAVGPGIPTTGDAFCLQDALTADAAFYYGFSRQCSTFKKAGSVAASTAEVTSMNSYCAAFLGGKTVTACPAEPVAAYCAGPISFVSAGGTLMFDLVKTVYQGTVTADASAVARNSLAICGPLANAVYDPANHHVQAICSGTVSASVDGVPVDFSKGLICTYTSDGTRTVYFLRGEDDPTSINLKSLSLSIYKDAMGVSLRSVLGASQPVLAALYPPVGYSEGSAAAGVFATPADPATITYQSQAFDATGAGLTGTFAIGVIKGSGTNMRTITAGTVNITFPTQ